MWRWRRRKPERSARAAERSCCRAPRTPLAGRKSCMRALSRGRNLRGRGCLETGLNPPFSPVVTNRDQRLARALCGTQAPGCSGFVRPLLRRERRGGRSRMLLEPGGRRGGWIGILTLSGDSKGVSGFLELRLCALPHFPPRPPRVGFRLRNSTLKVDCLPRLVA